jgi:magnesium transporter
MGEDMIKSITYENNHLTENINIGNIQKKLKEKSLIWLDLVNPDDNEIKILKNTFKFHHLAIEDCIHRVQRPKVNKYRDYYFIVLNAFKEKDVKKGFTYTDIYIFMGENYIVTLHWDPIEIMDRAYGRVADDPDAFGRGIDFILYTIFDEIVDDYFPLTDRIGDRIDNLEELIIRLPKKRIQDDIMVLKRTLVKLRRILAPQREVINVLLRHDYKLINEENRLYFMDVYDHLLRIFDLTDTYQDLLSSALDLYMSQISNRMNEIMKVLTIITTLMMPMTVISGIYGMNFQYMPGLQTKSGFGITLVLMLVIVAAEVVYFKVKKWL